MSILYVLQCNTNNPLLVVSEFGTGAYTFTAYVMVTSSPALQESTKSFSNTTHMERGM